MMVFIYFLGYLGDELNRACVGNGTGAESESFASHFVRFMKLRVTHSINSLCFYFHSI